MCSLGGLAATGMTSGRWFTALLDLFRIPLTAAHTVKLCSSERGKVQAFQGADAQPLYRYPLGKTRNMYTTEENSRNITTMPIPNSDKHLSGEAAAWWCECSCSAVCEPFLQFRQDLIIFWQLQMRLVKRKAKWICKMIRADKFKQSN